MLSPVRFSSLVIFIAFWTGAQYSHAQSTADEILLKVQDTYKNVITLSADFQQALSIALTDEVQKSEGTFILHAPEQFYMEYEAPEKQKVISDGQKVWIYDQEMKQVIIRSAEVIDPTLNPLYFLSHVNDDYLAELKDEVKVDGKTCWHLILKVKEKNDASVIRKMEVWADKNDCQVRQFQIFNANDDYTTYTLKKVKINPPLKTDQFAFLIPKGVEVIDETRK